MELDELLKRKGSRQNIHVMLLDTNVQLLDRIRSTTGKSRGEIIDALLTQYLAPRYAVAKKKKGT